MLLLVGAIHSVVVRTAVTKQGSPNVHIMQIFDVGDTIHQTPMYKNLESVLARNER